MRLPRDRPFRLFGNRTRGRGEATSRTIAVSLSRILVDLASQCPKLGDSPVLLANAALVNVIAPVQSFSR